MSETLQKNDLNHCYIVIMAGGSGTRLWPLSRKGKPKQFQAFTSDQTMVQETFSRASLVVPMENIFVSTTQNYASIVLAQIPEMAQNRLILEPEARNTAPAIALVATTLSHHDPDAIVATIASDHAIENNEEFVATLRSAFLSAQKNQDKLVTVGISPTRPDTGLGYIKMGQECGVVEGKRIFEIDEFKEKPDQKTAEQYILEWQYLWNAGYFIFSAKTFGAWTQEFAPVLHDIMNDILTHKKKNTLDDETLATLYAKTVSEPIEPLIVEKLSVKKRLVVPSSLKWSDVGNWETLYDFLHEKTGDSLVVHHDNHIDLGSKNCFIQGEKRLITTLGLKNLVIIDTPDALFIGRRDQAGSEMKKLIEKLKENGKKEVL